MTQRNLDCTRELAALADARYQVDLAQLQSIVGEETRLRSELQKLAGFERENAATDPADMLALRQLGGDILWQAWIGRKREELNLCLATVMARKLMVMQKLKVSFGKRSAAQSLEDRESLAFRKRLANKTAAQDQQQVINSFCPRNPWRP